MPRLRRCTLAGMVFGSFRTHFRERHGENGDWILGLSRPSMSVLPPVNCLARLKCEVAYSHLQRSRFVGSGGSEWSVGGVDLVGGFSVFLQQPEATTCGSLL